MTAGIIVKIVNAMWIKTNPKFLKYNEKKNYPKTQETAERKTSCLPAEIFVIKSAI